MKHSTKITETIYLILQNRSSKNAN